MIRFGIAVLCICAGAAVLSAQKPGTTDSMAARPMCLILNIEADAYTIVSITLPEGSADLVFPKMLVSGEKMNVLIVTQAEGRTDEDKARNRARLDSFRVAVSTGSAPLRNGSTLSATIQREDRNNRRVDLITDHDRILCHTFVPAKFIRRELISSEDDVAPVMVVQNEFFDLMKVAGRFDVDLPNTKIAIGDRPALVVAVTPEQLIARLPDSVAGMLPVRISNGGTTVQKSIRFIKLMREEDKNQRGQVHLTLSGLDNLTEPLDLVFQNRWWATGFVPRSLNPFRSPKDADLRWETRRIEPRDVQDGRTYSTEFRPKHGGIADLEFSVVPVAAALHIQTVIPQAVTGWSKDNRIEITREAQDLVLKGFEAQETQLSKLIAEPERHNWMPNTLLLVLVRAYLFWLRDANGSAPTPQKHSPLAFRFLQVSPAGVSDPLTRNAIGAMDVMEHPLADFLKDLWSRINGEVVHITIDSDPHPLRVLLDSKFLGATSMETIVSPGKHILELKDSAGRSVCAERIPICRDQWQVWQCGQVKKPSC